MINYIKNKKREHNYIFCAILLSIILNIIHFLYIIYPVGSFEMAIVLLPWFLGQTALIFVISFLSASVDNTMPIFSKIFSGIFNSLVLMFQIFIVSFFVYLLYSPDILDDDKPFFYNDINDYAKAKKEINCSKCIKHFPKEIPSNAKNIHFYMTYNVWMDYDEEIFIVFDTDENYINREMEKYKNIIPAKTPFRSSCNQITFDDNSYRFVEDDFEFYQIGYKKRLLGDNRFAEYGIGINKKTNTIIYYFDESDCL